MKYEHNDKIMTRKEVQEKWAETLTSLSIEEITYIAGFCLQCLVEEGKLSQRIVDECGAQLD